MQAERDMAGRLNSHKLSILLKHNCARLTIADLRYLYYFDEFGRKTSRLSKSGRIRTINRPSRDSVQNLVVRLQFLLQKGEKYDTILTKCALQRKHPLLLHGT